MTNTNKRILISDRIGYTEILDPKLKTNTIRICFFQPLSQETASACALAGDLITSTNADYPTNAAMNRKMHRLYGADLGASVAKHGDLQLVTLRASAIADAYAWSDEPVFDTLTEILFDCLRKPNVKDGAFDPNEFRMKQKELLDSIDAEINEKRIYAVHQAQKTAYQNEPAALSSYGTREQAESLTPQSVYRALQTMLQTATVEIFFVGPVSQPTLPQKIRSTFAQFCTGNMVLVRFESPSPVKASPVSVCEVLPVNQCKMVMVWKTTDSNRYAVKLASLIFGGTPSAKLFANVREKMSLCYYCAANYEEAKRAMVVDCGIETENIKKTRQAILDQLDAMCAGEITDDEIQSVQMALHNSLCSIGDTPASYINWYSSQLMRGTCLTPQEEEAMYQSVTKEEIVAAAQSMQLDTIYTMECAE